MHQPAPIIPTKADRASLGSSAADLWLLGVIADYRLSRAARDT